MSTHDVADLFAIFASVFVLGGSMYALYALWQHWRSPWNPARRIPPERRRRATLLTVVVVVPLVAVLLAVGIVAPWGKASIAYVVLALAAIVVPVCLVGAALQARQDIRRAKKARLRSPHDAGREQ